MMNYIIDDDTNKIVDCLVLVNSRQICLIGTNKIVDCLLLVNSK